MLFRSTENFRSSRTVVAAAQRLDSSYSVDGQLPVEGAVELIESDDEPGEAAAVVSQIKTLLSKGHPDIEGSISLGRCAVLGRNRFVFGALEEELKTQNLPFYTKFSSAAYQSESDIVEQFELALRLLANPRDRLHLGILSKAWGAQLAETDLLSGTFGGNPLSLIQALAKDAKKGCAQAVMDAVTAMQWTGNDFRFLNALAKIEGIANGLAEEDRALVLQDTREWKKHWDYYVRSEPGGLHSITSFLGQVALGTTQQPKDEDRKSVV